MATPVSATITVGEETEAKEEATTRYSGLRFYLRYISKDISALIGGIIIVIFLGFGIIEGTLQEVGLLIKDPSLGYALLPSNPVALNFAQKYIPPCWFGSASSCSSAVNFLGTNDEGQSILSRLMYATPHDALAAVLVVSVGIGVGMLVGTTSGYFGGWVDDILMRATDAFLALPGLILAIAIAVLLGPGFTSALLALITIWWPTYARFFKGQAVQIKNRGYVEAAKLNGIGSFKILMKHLFPNSIDPIIAYATLDFGSVILTYASLAFLGIGVELGYPEWGNEAAVGLQFFPQFWWMAIIPSILIMAVVVAFTLVGDRVQDLVGGRINR
jgi:peptide/nickel transport system permease protein